jgi:hypothetical protein
VPVAVLFNTKFVELGRLCRVRLFESVRKVMIDAGVFFFERNCQCEDFLFGETVEVSHGKSCRGRAEFGAILRLGAGLLTAPQDVTEGLPRVSETCGRARRLGQETGHNGKRSAWKRLTYKKNRRETSLGGLIDSGV